MAIQFIDNQPITFKTDWETDSECKTSNEKACTLYSRDDYMFAQFKQTKCDPNDPNIFCDPPFVDTVGEFVTNGTFDTDASGWTLDNSTYDGSAQAVKFSPVLNGDVYQTLSGLSVGSWYTLTFTLFGATNGYIYVYISGTSYEAIRYTEGTYTLNFQYTAGDDILAFYTESDIPTGKFPYNGWVDSVSITQSILLQTCWEGTPADWVINSETSITKVSNTISILTANFPVLPNNTYCKLTLVVSGMTQGTLTIKETNSNTIGVVDHNGLFEFYYTMNYVNSIQFIGDEDFNGTLSGFFLERYGNNFQFVLTNDTYTYNLSAEAEYVQDWVTLKADMSGVVAGCYNLVVYDACGYNVDTEITTDPNLLDGGKWGITDYSLCNAIFSGTSSFRIEGASNTPTAQNSYAAITSYPTDGFTNTQQGSSYVVDYTITTGDVDVDAAFAILPWINMNPLALDAYGTLTLNHLQPNTTYTGQFIMLEDPASSHTEFWIQSLTGSSLLIGQTIEITHIELRVQSWVPGQAQAYYSNCIEITEDTDCTKWVAGTNDEDAYGFHFDPDNVTPFQLGARVRSMLINPKYPGDYKRYTNAKGKHIVTSGVSTKTFTLFIDYTDEHTHDWLRLATHCDTINIGYSFDSNKQYVATDGDYEPEWPSNIGNWPAAQARVDVQQKVSTLYDNNAG